MSDVRTFLKDNQCKYKTIDEFDRLVTDSGIDTSNKEHVNMLAKSLVACYDAQFASPPKYKIPSKLLHNLNMSKNYLYHEAVNDWNNLLSERQDTSVIKFKVYLRPGEMECTMSNIFDVKIKNIVTTYNYCYITLRGQFSGIACCQGYPLASFSFGKNSNTFSVYYEENHLGPIRLGPGLPNFLGGGGKSIDFVINPNDKKRLYDFISSHIAPTTRIRVWDSEGKKKIPFSQINERILSTFL